MAQRIAKKTVGGVSVWDVHFPVKTGTVNLTGRKLEWLEFMRNEGPGGPGVPSDLTWEESLRFLFKNIFQKHIDDGQSVFSNVPMLHFLKFSLAKKDGRTYFCFTTPFDDPGNPPEEQRYIDDMYAKYGAMMEVVWAHCEGVTQLLKHPIQLPAPPQPVGPRPQGYKLSDQFLALVDAGNVDFHEDLCFYNANPGASPTKIKNWKKDSKRLEDVTEAVIEARLAQADPSSDKAAVLEKLLKRMDELQV